MTSARLVSPWQLLGLGRRADWVCVQWAVLAWAAVWTVEGAGSGCSPGPGLITSADPWLCRVRPAAPSGLGRWWSQCVVGSLAGGGVAEAGGHRCRLDAVPAGQHHRPVDRAPPRAGCSRVGVFGEQDLELCGALSGASVRGWLSGAGLGCY